MSLKNPLIAEFKNEGVSTKKMLERVPEKSFSWTPHEKSMTVGRLATHFAEIPCGFPGPSKMMNLILQPTHLNAIQQLHKKNCLTFSGKTSTR